ncbi:MAG: rod shape-determining protein MreC [Planctomycetaceae bacterium]
MGTEFRRELRRESRQLRMWITACLMSLLAAVALVADRTGLLTNARPIVHDILSPGRLILLAVSRSTDASRKNDRAQRNPSDPESGRADSDSHVASSQETLLRTLMIENARLRRDLKRRQASDSPFAERSRDSLVELQSVPAKILSRSGLPDSLRELMIDAGQGKGIRRSELVVQGDGILLDVGTKDTVRAGDRVVDGLAVIGRIDKTAQWVSLVLPVSAKGFKARARILRIANDEAHFGATGMLEGLGNGECSLTGIAHTEAVAIGDQVVSMDVNGVDGPVLTFGEVVKADFLAGGQWDVRVKPVVNFDDADDVQVLCWELRADP